MKKFAIAVVAIVLIAACVIGVFTVKDKISENDKLRISESSSLSEIMDFYKNAVNKSKDNKDFQLNVTTNIKLDAINGSNILLNEAISAFIGYKVGDSEGSTSAFKFVNGIDSENTSIYPISVIQPAGSYIENYNATAVSINNIKINGNAVTLSAELAKETADLDKVVAAINPIVKGNAITDKSAIIALAPNHSSFIDVGNVMSTVVDMLGISNMVNGSDNKEKTSSLGNTIGIAGGECSIGNTKILSDVNENGLLDQVTITAPVELNADFKFMNSIIKSSIIVTVVQTYSFSYNG